MKPACEFVVDGGDECDDSLDCTIVPDIFPGSVDEALSSSDRSS
jgi:hypothetical protein